MRKKIMAAILVLAVSICLLSVGIARAFKVEIHGDLNNRYEANNKANMFYGEDLITGSKANYISCGHVNARDLTGKNGKERMDDDSAFWGEAKYRM